MRSLALRNLLSRKRRTLLIALAVIVGVAQITGAFVLTDGMNRAVDELFENGQKGVDVVVTAKGGSRSDPATIDRALVARTAGVDGTREAVGQVSAVVAILGPDGEPVSSGPPAFALSRLPDAISPWRLQPGGRWAASDDEAVLDAATARRVGYAVGDRLEIVGVDRAERPRITGLAALGGGGTSAGAAFAITTGATAGRLGGRDGRVDRISVDADGSVSADALQARIAAELRDEPVTVRTAADQAASQASSLKSQLGFLRPVLLAFGIIALFVGSFVIVNTFSATLAQRSQELALLRALGATRGQVIRSVLTESLLIGVLAGALGLLAGLLVAPGILALFRGFGIDLPADATTVLPRTIVVALLIGPVVTTLAGLMPVRRAASVPPIQAMRGETTRERRDRPGPMAYVIGALAVAAIIGSQVAGGPSAVLIGVGALLTLIAVAQLAPLVLEPILAVVGAPVARLGLPGRLARLNAIRQPRRTATTAGALMVGVALVTFVAVFAAGLSAIAKDAFSDHVKADLALSDASGQGFPAGAQDVVRADRDVEAVTGITYSGFEVVGRDQDVPVAGVDAGIPSVYRLNWVDGDDRLLDDLGRRDVIADRGAQNATVAAARVGDRLRLKRSNGEEFVVTVRGTVDEGSSLLGGSFFARRSLVVKGTTQPRIALSLVKLRAGADRGAVQRRLDAALEDRYPIVDALSRGELEARVVGQVNQLVNMIYAFLAFALIVSLLGISTTFTLTVQERRRELGMMRAIGATRRQVRRLVRLEAVLTGLLGGVLGVAIGLGFGALVVRLLADDGFGFVVPVPTVIGVLALAAVVAAGAATLPARRAGRVDIVDALGVD